MTTPRIVTLAPTPKYISRKANGQPNIGGYIETYVNLTTTHKATTSDPLGMVDNPWPTPFDGQGEANIYWEITDDLYTIKEYDSLGNIINTQDNYPTLEDNTVDFVDETQSNVVRNAQFSFWDYGTQFTFGSGNGGSQDDNDFICNDWLYKKDGNGANVIISADPVVLADVSGIDGNPINLFKYVASGAIGGTFNKFYQRYPKVQTFAGRNISFGIYAKSADSTPINIYAIQNFGTGGSPSTEVKTLLASITLNNTLTRYIAENVPIAALTNPTIGTDGNDAFLIQVEFPLDRGATVNLTNVEISQTAELSETFPPNIYATQILELISTIRNGVFTTGDVKPTYKTVSDPGWLMMNDQTIGSPASAATSKGIALLALYTSLWNNVINTWAPVSGGRGVSALADYNAGKTLTLCFVLGRALASAGTGAALSARVLGQQIGTENNTLAASNLPASLSASITGTVSTNITDTGTTTITSLSGATPIPVTITNVGSGVALNNMQPTAFVNFMIKL